VGGLKQDVRPGRTDKEGRPVIPNPNPNPNRREALGALGLLGAAAAAAATGSTPLPARGGPVELGPYNKRPGVQGRMTGAQAAAAALCCMGVRCVFGIPGAQNNEFWDALKARQVPYLLVAHESSASVMADAAARVTGEVGVFSVVPGPGLTNAMTGIGEALMDSVPIVGIITDIDQGGNAPAGQVHGLANSEIVKPVVKAVFEVHNVAEIPGAIFQAFCYTRLGEPGPVAVIIPYHFYSEVWDFNCGIPLPYPLAFDEAAYRQAVCLLSDPCRKVGIYAGLGCMDAGPSLVAVAEMLQAPVATSVSGKGCIPDSHPLAVGWGYGRQGTRAAECAFKHVDTVLAVGVRYSEVSTADYSIPKHDKLIHVDVNPAILGKSVDADVKVCADARLFLDRLLCDAPVLKRPPAPKLVKLISEGRALDRHENTKVQITCGVDPMIFLTQLRAALGPEELIFVDVTASTHWASEAMMVEGPRRYFTPANNQSMGWALPAAIGAQRVRPDRMVVSVTGDGCFLMGAMELSTAARAGLPVKFFVFDDGTYHYMQMLQEPVYRRTTATEIARINYAAFAHAMGLGYNEIPHNADIPCGIGRALAFPGPILTRVLISYEGRELRWLRALRSTYLRKLPKDQQIRLVARIGVRVLDHHPQND
jgi:acetolactate synthase-1/2/3 large subunit